MELWRSYRDGDDIEAVTEESRARNRKVCACTSGSGLVDMGEKKPNDYQLQF